MFKAALAGAVALATVGTFSISSDGVRTASALAREIIVSHAQISRLKNALRLTAEQEHLWRPVEARLREIARQQHQRVASADTGFVGRTQGYLSDYALTTASLQRLRSAAEPLIGRLTDEQRQAGLQVLQAMGMSF